MTFTSSKGALLHSLIVRAYQVADEVIKVGDFIQNHMENIFRVFQAVRHIFVLGFGLIEDDFLKTRFISKAPNIGDSSKYTMFRQVPKPTTPLTDLFEACCDVEPNLG